MRHTRVEDKERGAREAPCPRCGGDAEWAFVDADRARVEVVCPNCGRIELDRADFDAAETEIWEPDDPR